GGGVGEAGEGMGAVEGGWEGGCGAGDRAGWRRGSAAGDETILIADPLGGGQRRQPEGGASTPRSARLSRGRGVERARGACGPRGTVLRRRPDGRADAPARRPRRLAADPRALERRPAAADHRDDRECTAGGS